MKKLVISTLFVMQVFFGFAQTTTGITGKVVDSKTQKPLQNVVASIQNTSLTSLTNGVGVFVFMEVSSWRMFLLHWFVFPALVFLLQYLNLYFLKQNSFGTIY